MERPEEVVAILPTRRLEAMAAISAKKWMQDDMMIYIYDDGMMVIFAWNQSKSWCVMMRDMGMRYVRRYAVCVTVMCY